MLSSHRARKYGALVGCTLLLTIVYMSLTSWSVAVNELAAAFDLSPVAVQLGSSALIAGYAIGGFVQGKLVQRFGWRPTFTGVIIAFLAASALIPVVDNYGLVLLLRFIQGVGLMVTVTIAVVSSWFPTRERGLAVGILLGAIGLGVAFGGWLTGVLTPLLGWQNTFWLITGITVLGAAVFYALVRPAPPLEEEQVGAPADDRAPRRSLYREPALWLLGFMVLCCFFNAYGMYAYLAQYLFTLDYTSVQVGLVVLLNGLVAVVSTPVGGLVSDRLVARKGALRARTWTNAWVALLVAALGCALLPHLAPLGLGFAALIAVVAGWGVPATNGPGFSLPSDLFGSAAAGPGVGLVLLVAGAGGIISPILVPWIASVSNWTVGWYVTAAVAVVGIIINLVLGSGRGVGSNPTAAVAGQKEA